MHFAVTWFAPWLGFTTPRLWWWHRDTRVVRVAGFDFTWQPSIAHGASISFAVLLWRKNWRT